MPKPPPATAHRTALLSIALLVAVAVAGGRALYAYAYEKGIMEGVTAAVGKSYELCQKEMTKATLSAMESCFSMFLPVAPAEASPSARQI
jgi:hypothetical protein